MLFFVIFILIFFISFIFYSVFGRLEEVRKNNHISFLIKVKLYESLVMAIMLYSAELWPLTVKLMKTLEAAHHKFQQRLLGMKWYDRVSNVEVSKRTRMAKLEEIIKERLGYVIRMEDCRVPNQALNCNLSSVNRKSGRLQKNWQDIIQRDLKDIGLTWDEASELAHSGSS